MAKDDWESPFQKAGDNRKARSWNMVGEKKCCYPKIFMPWLNTSGKRSLERATSRHLKGISGWSLLQDGDLCTLKHSRVLRLSFWELLHPHLSHSRMSMSHLHHHWVFGGCQLEKEEERRITKGWQSLPLGTTVSHKGHCSGKCRSVPLKVYTVQYRIVQNKKPCAVMLKNLRTLSNFQNFRINMT